MRHLTPHQFSASVDGILQGVPARLMESHLASCADCRGRWDGFVATEQAIADLMRHDGTPEFHAKLAATLDRAATDEGEDVEPPIPEAQAAAPPPAEAPATAPPGTLELVPVIAQIQAPAVETQVVPAATPTAPTEEKPAARSGSGRHMTHHQLSAWLDGELIGVSGQLVERHLAVCDACRSRWEGFRDARGTLVELFDHTADADFDRDLERILGEIATKGAAPAWLETGPAPARPIPPRPAPPDGPSPAPVPETRHDPAPDPPAVIDRKPAPPPIERPARRVARERQARDRGGEAALSWAWMLTAVCVLAAVAWVSWMLWDYHRRGTLAPAIIPGTPETTEAGPNQAVEATPGPSAEAIAPPTPATEIAGTLKDSVAPAPPPPVTPRAAAPGVEPGAPRVTAPDPGRAAPAAGAAATRPAPARTRPAEPRPTPAQATPTAPAEPHASSTPKKAVAATALGLLCGRVSDENHQPVEGARVLLADLEAPVATDRNGGFCVSAPLGERTVSIVALGFETSRQVVVVGPQTLEILVTLRTPAAATTPRDPR